MQEMNVEKMQKLSAIGTTISDKQYQNDKLPGEGSR
mgnify:CR=1 FL=1